MLALLILGSGFVPFMALLAFGLCKVAGEGSRWEEEAELRHLLGRRP